MRKALQRTAQDDRDHNVVAMLSLYLLLLAFFILLNALSKLETDRTRDVINSVNEAFNGQVDAVASVEPYPAALETLDETDAILEELRKLFDSMIPVEEAEESADAPVLRLGIPAERLFLADGTRLRPGRALLLERIVAALRASEAKGLHHEIELIHTFPSGGRVGPSAGSLEVRRLGALVDILAQQGLVEAQLSIGVAPGPEGLIRLVFRIYEEPPAPVDLSQVAG